jgi:thiol-disulfide isomerase/thioredoxin
MRFLSRGITSIALIVALGAAGCGKDGGDSSLVEPPESVSPQISTSQNDDPPGEMVLPDDAAIENESESGDDSSSEKGLEMPSDLVPPEQTSSRHGGEAISETKIRYASWSQIQDTATSTGKVTVVDLWSLVCEPCLKEFPNLVQLHRDLGDKIQCIAVDVDYDGRKTRPPETYEDRVVAFLDSVGADFPTYISRTPSDEVFAAADLASIPAVMVYDADGQLVQVFEDAGETAGFTYQKDIVPLVTKLTS